MPHDATVPRTVVENIETIVRLEEGEENNRNWSERLSDGIAGFVGRVSFVLGHLALFTGWAVVNAGITPIPAFDPYPFNFLTMFVSLEGVLLSTFVLIKQNRMSLRADRRSHLDLQINLLTEKEVTHAIQLLAAISARLGADGASHETRELARTTAVGELAQELGRKLPDV